MMSIVFRRVVLFPACLTVAGGCYRSVPVEATALAPGREVVMELSPRGTLDLAPLLGAQVNSVMGRIVDVSPTRFRLSVTQTTARGGVETLWKGENADLPREHVTSIAERRVDKKRSWIVAGITVLGAALIGEAFGINTGLDGFITGGSRGSRK